MTTAFVLSGGGSLGAVQVGMLLALAERGVGPDLLVGSSVGAVNAAWLAGRPGLEGVRDRAAVWRSVRRDDVFPLSPLQGLLGFAGRRDHLIDPGKAAAILGMAGLSLSVLPSFAQETKPPAEQTTALGVRGHAASGWAPTAIPAGANVSTLDHDQHGSDASRSDCFRCDHGSDQAHRGRFHGREDQPRACSRRDDAACQQSRRDHRHGDDDDDFSILF